MKRFVLAGLFFLSALVVIDVVRFAQLLEPEESSKTFEGSVDVIAVLTGGQGRFKEAFGFLQQVRSQYLFISGIRPGTQLSDIFKANRIEFNADEFADRIILGDESRSTAENAIEIRKIVERLNAQSLLVVTSDYHLKRALNLVSAQLKKDPELKTSVRGYAVESPNFPAEHWWRTQVGWGIMLSEYFKTWFQLFRA